MGITLVHVTMSLDGFIAGPGDEMDWIFEAVTPDDGNEMGEATISSIGAVLAGRNTWNVGQKAARPETSELYGGRWHGPEFVLTHDPPERADPAVTFLSGDIAQAVATAHEAAGEGDLLVLGADVIRQCLDAGLIDELRIHVAPVVLGAGVALFSSPRERAFGLEQISATQVGQVANLRYRVTDRAM